MTFHTPSTRAEVITRRTYNRPKPDGSFETWDQTVDRVVAHQRWLWERALKKPLDKDQKKELKAFRKLLIERKCLPSGRTLWLGGTEVSKRREASQFNCSFERATTVSDIVDGYWLLLQGCGLGFEPIMGTLNGFSKPVYLDIIRSTKVPGDPKGTPDNLETIENVYVNGNHKPLKTWTIVVGDSAEAWAKLPGKLLAQKVPCDRLVLDFSEIRASGQRLTSYGWISAGDQLLAEAMTAIVKLLNERSCQLLTRIDILDLLNWLGSTLSTRRSAEICTVPYGDPEWVEFAKAKREYWVSNPQRSQSNNSVVFYHKPSRSELFDILGLMVESGGSEPGLINGQTALKRAPWFKGVNPCAEILLGDKSFCNLVEINLAAFNGDWAGLLEAIRIMARANYRQTCVNLRDGILQDNWHELNDFLRLCGVGLTGIVQWEYAEMAECFQELKKVATLGAHKMADELGLPRSKAVTTVKPSGTLSKIMDTTEGLHKPLGRYIFNNVKFSKADPLVAKCLAAGYTVFDAPDAADACIITFPVEWANVGFDVSEGKHVNLETAVHQLDRYKLLMDNYVDHNASITVSYEADEVPSIVNWLHENWESYVGVSFLFRADPTKTAADLGYPYLPQEVVSKASFDAYVSRLKPLEIDGSHEELMDEGCASGACPIR